MTAIIDPATVTPPMQRWANVVRIHVANPWPTIITPWLVFAAVFGLTYAIWSIVLTAAGPGGIEPDGFQYNGGVTWIFIFLMVVAIQAMSQTFPFALGFSVTRRDYSFGTALYFVLLAAIYSIGITVLAGAESVTGGWGVYGGFFAPAFMASLPLVQVAFVYFAALLFLLFFGAAVGSVFVRWGSNGILIFFGVVALLLVASIWWVTNADAWGPVGAFFTDNSVPTLLTWSLAGTIVFAVVGYVLMRRATPRA
jgi:hypothetical protein